MQNLPAMNRYDRNLQIIYIAILMSTLIYAVVAWATTHAIAPGKTLSDELHDPVTIALYSVAAGMFLAAMIVRARKVLIVRWVMIEAACICGLIAAMMHGDWRLYIAPWALGLIGFISLYPRVRMATR
jgi:peptidoglycan/LPS O-acetylase OafA/YrhL